MTRSLLPTTLVTLFIVAVQISILSSLRIDGVVIMMVWLWPLALGLAGATTESLWVALVGGVLFDTHASTPFGVTALVALALAFGSSQLGKEGVGDIESAAWWVTPVICGVAGLFAPALYVLAGAFWLNFSLWHDSVGEMMLVNGAMFLLFARPLVRIARWTATPSRIRR